jgi:hypothetical protein
VFRTWEQAFAAHSEAGGQKYQTAPKKPAVKAAMQEIFKKIQTIP